jgi:hypothetical protein
MRFCTQHTREFIPEKRENSVKVAHHINRHVFFCMNFAESVLSTPNVLVEEFRLCLFLLFFFFFSLDAFH